MLLCVVCVACVAVLRGAGVAVCGVRWGCCRRCSLLLLLAVSVVVVVVGVLLGVAVALIGRCVLRYVAVGPDGVVVRVWLLSVLVLLVCGSRLFVLLLFVVCVAVCGLLVSLVV